MFVERRAIESHLQGGIVDILLSDMLNAINSRQFNTTQAVTRKLNVSRGAVKTIQLT